MTNIIVHNLSNTCDHKLFNNINATTINDYKYTYVNHTADICIRSFGNNFLEALIALGIGTMGIMTDLTNITVKEAYIVCLETSSNKKSIVNEFISELIGIYGEHYFITKKIHIYNFNVCEKKHQSKLCFAAYGERFDPTKHRSLCEVKSVTMHNLKVDEANNTLEIIVDV